ncbi:3-ketoacyl-CoA synthase 8-like [Capsicum galapagoense]
MNFPKLTCCNTNFQLNYVATPTSNSIMLQHQLSNSCKSRRSGLKFKEETLVFMDRILQRCSLGYNTYISKVLLKKPTDMSAEAAIEEVERAVFGVIDELLMKTGVQCENISILVTVCGVFNIMPSLSSVIVRRYNLRHEHRTYNITGMECTAGLLALGLVQNLLKIHGNSYALLVSTDSLTENVYKGNDRSKLLSNCIFRVAGVAFLLSNKPSDQNTSKYEFIRTIRSQTSNNDRSYNYIFMEEDVEGHLGITINKDLLYAAIKTIRLNISIIAPLVLPLSEKFRYFINLIVRRFLLRSNVEPYNLYLSKTIDHFLLGFLP